MSRKNRHDTRLHYSAALFTCSVHKVPQMQNSRAAPLCGSFATQSKYKVSTFSSGSYQLPPRADRMCAYYGVK